MSNFANLCDRLSARKREREKKTDILATSDYIMEWQLTTVQSFACRRIGIQIGTLDSFAQLIPTLPSAVYDAQ